MSNEAYDIANEVDVLCGTQGACKRHDCNGFICRNAIDAVVRSLKTAPTVGAAPGAPDSALGNPSQTGAQ